jgi:broad specificity phosphatase PhoE
MWSTLNRQPPVLLLTLGAVAGTMVTLTMVQQWRRKRMKRSKRSTRPPNQYAKDRRERLPSFIILVRHGESEGNADQSLFRTLPDNLVSLTEKGIQQSEEAGRHIEEIIFQQASTAADNDEQEQVERVHMVVSPFERTLQTAAAMRPWFEHRIVRTDVQPRIREQEFGNLQGDDFTKLREEQKKVGRFWYRFPTGESGSDVFDRVKSWWYESVLSVNERVGYDYVDALVVVTHGLTMRFVLMQLYSWSPTTFHSVWNAGNCDIYVLRKDLSKPGMSPYVLDGSLGDTPQSSIDVMVRFKSTGEQRILKVQNYLSIPPPRTTRIDLVKQNLVEQYPDMDQDDIESLVFMPFIDRGHVQGRTTSGGLGDHGEAMTDRSLEITRCPPPEHPRPHFQHPRHDAPQETSCRFPNVLWLNDMQND